MRKRLVLMLAVVIVVALVGTLVYAQGRGPGAGVMKQNGPAYGTCPRAGAGPGPGAGYGRTGQPCPFGNTQPNPNAGGWWSKAQPLTDEQRAFVEKVRGLHDRIRTQQMELNTLRARNGDRNRIAALEKELQGLRTELHEYMIQNRELRMQMGSGMGPCCQKMANCPMYKEGKCPGPNAACCANCPYRDQCPCPMNQARRGPGAGPGPCCPLASPAAPAK